MGSFIITKAITHILHSKKSWHIVSRWKRMKRIHKRKTVRACTGKEKEKGGQSDKALPKGEILRT